MIASRLVSLAAVLTLTATAVGQSQAYVLSHPVLTDDFGASLQDLGDLDGDGVTDIAVGQPGLLSGGGTTGVSVLRGAAGTELYFFTGPATINAYGASLGVLQDLDGDGTRDLIIGAPGSPSIANDTTYVEVRSGASGSVLRAFFGPTGSAYGAAVVGCEDVDGDGTLDLAIGAPAHTNVANEAGAVYMISGLTGNTLYRLDGASAFEAFGRALTTIADQDGDGLRDLLIGAPGGNRAAIHSSATGALIRNFPGPASTRAFGFSVDAVDDYDADGLEDVIIGAPEEVDASGPNAGATRVYSSGTGNLLYEFMGFFAGDFAGHSVADIGDLDFDGVRDFAFGAPLLSSSSFFPAGFVSARSGATGALLFNASGPSTAAAFGFSIGPVADFDQDGLPEVLCGTPGRGEVIAISFGQSAGSTYCFGSAGANCPCGNVNDGSELGGNAGCANSAHLGGSSLIALGPASASQNTTVLRASNAQPGQPGLLFQADNALNGGAGVLFGDGLRCAGGNVVRLEVLSLDAQGDGLSSVFLAAAGGLGGGELRRYQLWYRDPVGSPCGAGFNLSNGVEISWTP